MVQISILIYNWCDIKDPGADGAEVFIYESTKRWVEKGNEATLFSSAFTGCEGKIRKAYRENKKILPSIKKNIE